MLREGVPAFTKSLNFNATGCSLSSFNTKACLHDVSITKKISIYALQSHIFTNILNFNSSGYICHLLLAIAQDCLHNVRSIKLTSTCVRKRGRVFAKILHWTHPVLLSSSIAQVTKDYLCPEMGSLKTTSIYLSLADEDRRAASWPSTQLVLFRHLLLFKL